MYAWGVLCTHSHTDVDPGQKSARLHPPALHFHLRVLRKCSTSRTSQSSQASSSKPQYQHVTRTSSTFLLRPCFGRKNPAAANSWAVNISGRCRPANVSARLATVLRLRCWALDVGVALGAPPRTGGCDFLAILCRCILPRHKEAVGTLHVRAMFVTINHESTQKKYSPKNCQQRLPRCEKQARLKRRNSQDKHSCKAATARKNLDPQMVR